MRRVKHICGTSVDDAQIDIKKEESSIILKACLHYEIRHGKRSTLIKSMKARIKKIGDEKNGCI